LTLPLLRAYIRAPKRPGLRARPVADKGP